MAGSGITSNNVVDIVKSTGITEVHLSAKKLVKSKKEYTKTT